LETIWWE
jgi:hypothetical protein